jgi:hypothetical protein
MQRLRLYHKTLIAQHMVIIAAIIFACVGSYFVGKQIISTLTSINVAANDVHATFGEINKPRTGTLAGLDQVIFGASALLKQTNGILNHEEKQLSTLDKQEAILFDDLHMLAGHTNDEVVTLNTTTGTLNTLLGTINISATRVPSLIDNVNKIATDADGKINDPHVAAFMANLEPLSNNAVAISGNVAGITKNFDATTTDFQTKFHTWLYPTPCKTAACKWGKVFKFAADISKFSEPAYYSQQLIQGIGK